MPWASTERKMVHVAISIKVAVPNPPSCRDSKAISVNTTDARPLGPNQPMKKMLAGRRPVPMVDIATGNIRTTVRHKTA
jgi:hypothetical protein